MGNGDDEDEDELEMTLTQTMKRLETKCQTPITEQNNKIASIYLIIYGSLDDFSADYLQAIDELSPNRWANAIEPLLKETIYVCLNISNIQLVFVMFSDFGNCQLILFLFLFFAFCWFFIRFAQYTHLDRNGVGSVGGKKSERE